MSSRSIAGDPYQPDATDEGSVFKINMLLRTLPKLKGEDITAGRTPFAARFTATKDMTK